MSVPSFTGKFPVRFASLDQATIATHSVVAAVPGKRVRVLSVFGIAGGACAVTFKTATTDIGGPLSLAANGGFSADSTHGLFETNQGEALQVALSAAVQVSLFVAYVLV